MENYTSSFWQIVPIISSIVSWIVWSLCTLWFKNRQERENRKQSISRDFTELLLKKRIETYPKLWELVSGIYWIKKNGWLKNKADAVTNNMLIRQELREWRKKNGVFLSNEDGVIIIKNWYGQDITIKRSCLNLLQDLENALHLKEKFQCYSKEKLDKIDILKNALLKSMKADLWILEKSQKNLKL